MDFLKRLYPIGIQTFEKIRNGNYLYIDKTEYVYRMAHSGHNRKALFSEPSAPFRKVAVDKYFGSLF